MKDSLRKQIYSRLNLKDTDELLEIWRNHDTNEWIDEVFEVVEEILIERFGELPSLPGILQDEPETGELLSHSGSDEAVLHDALDSSVVMEQLDQAYWCACDGELEKALQACKAVQPATPEDAEAWNYLGIIYDTLGQVEPAIETYLKAAQLAPEFSAARKNLRNARVRLEGEQYHRAASLSMEETQALCTHVDQADEADIIESEEPIPGWYYLDETAYLLPGWPGYRTRPGRSGYDQLDSSYELSRIEGIIVRKLITCTMRTRNPVQLLYMILVGLILCYPLVMVVELFRGDWLFAFPVISQLPAMFVGIMLLVNVGLSLMVGGGSREEEPGDTFI